MTSVDRARAARIAAFQFALGSNVPTIERYLLSYAPAMTEEDVIAAISLGREVHRLGQLVTSGQDELAGFVQQLIQADLPGGMQALVHYQIGPNAEKDWRSTSVLLSGAETPQEIRALAQREVRGLVSQGGQGRYPVLADWTIPQAISSIGIAYIGPTGLGALPQQQ